VWLRVCVSGRYTERLSESESASDRERRERARKRERERESKIQIFMNSVALCMHKIADPLQP
jgi:hypothetical protein